MTQVLTTPASQATQSGPASPASPASQSRPNAKRAAPDISPVTSNTKAVHESGLISLPYPANVSAKFSPKALYDRPELARSAGHLTPEEETRRSRMAKAAAWYTSQGLTVTPVHFPVIPARPATGNVPAIPGVNSDGKWFSLEWIAPEDSSLTGDPDAWTLRQAKTFVVTDPATNRPAIQTITAAGKNPVLTGYLRNPDCRAETPAEAEHLWSKAPWNIGVITGKQTGVVVLDVDVRSGGLESFAKLEKAVESFNIALPENARLSLGGTYSYYTSGLNPDHSVERCGFHVYFRVNPDDDKIWSVLNRLGVNALPGIEIKQKPGIVVAAPSMHATGAVYAFRDRSPVVTLTRPQIETFFTAVKAVRENVDLSALSSPFTDTSGLSSSGGSLGSLASLSYSSSSAGPAGISSGGDLTWRDAGTERDDPAFDGFWSRQVEHWLMTGSAAVQYGPGEHHDSLKPLIGSLVRLVPPSDTLAWYYHEKMSKDESWLPPLYLSLMTELDEAVSLPEPWHKTEFSNMCGILRHALMNELARLTWGTQ